MCDLKLDLLSALAKCCKAGIPAQYQKFLAVQIVNVKIHSQQVTSESGKLARTLSKVLTLAQSHQSTPKRVIIFCQVTCVEGCLQIIIRLFRTFVVIPRYNTVLEEGGGSVESLQGSSQKPSLHSTQRYADQDQDQASDCEDGIQDASNLEMRKAIQYTVQICEWLPSKFLQGAIQVQVDRTLVELNDGEVRCVRRCKPKELMPEIVGVRPPCIPFKFQGSVTVDVSVGRWRGPWRMLVIHTGNATGEFCFRGLDDDVIDETGYEDGQEMPSNLAANEYLLTVEVVVKDNGNSTLWKQKRQVNLGHDRAGAVNFLITGQRESCTPCTSGAAPMLLLPPNVAQEVNGVFAKMVTCANARGNFENSGCAQQYAWSKYFKGMAVEMECLLVALPSWKNWLGDSVQRRAQYMQMLKRIVLYTKNNDMWQTMAFLLRYFVRNTGCVNLDGVEVVEQDLTAEFLKHTQSVLQSQSQIQAEHASTVPEVQTPSSSGNLTVQKNSEDMKNSSNISNTIAGNRIPQNGALLTESTHLDFKPSSTSRINELEMNFFDRGAKCASSLAPQSTEQTFEFDENVANESKADARTWMLFGFRDKSMEASYNIYINQHHMIVDSAVLLIRVVSCAIVAWQVYQVEDVLTQRLVGNLIWSVVLWIPVLWGELYAEHRHLWASFVRVLRVGSIALWWLTGWTHGACWRMSIEGGRLMWDAVMFTLWLQVNFSLHVLLGGMEMILLVVVGMFEPPPGRWDPNIVVR